MRSDNSSNEGALVASPFRTGPYVESLLGTGVPELNMPELQLRFGGRAGSGISQSEPSERFAESWSIAYLQVRFDFWH
jgi:hypothetical protein